jgi:hypothetical protein
MLNLWLFSVKNPLDLSEQKDPEVPLATLGPPDEFDKLPHKPETPPLKRSPGIYPNFRKSNEPTPFPTAPLPPYTGETSPSDCQDFSPLSHIEGIGHMPPFD